MKGTDRMILVALPLLAVVVGFWLLVLGPKRAEVGDLGKEAETLRSEISVAESELATAEQAQAAFPDNYAELVALGAAVPEDDDQATFVHDLSELARQDSVSFRSFLVTPGTGTPVAAPPAPAPTDPAVTETTATTPAPPTEAAAASLPLGATVGPAGLPVTPYGLKYFGEFFDMADLFAALDSRVEITETDRGPKVDGRLVTIDGFTMSADPVRGFPRVQTELNVTTYLVPPEQGIAAGATPAGPTEVAVTPTAIPAATAPGTTAAVTP